jgi:hypothetical protein
VFSLRKSKGTNGKDSLVFVGLGLSIFGIYGLCMVLILFCDVLCLRYGAKKW